VVHIHFSVSGIGLGHASRSHVIIKEAERRGLSYSISTYGDAVDYFHRRGLKVYKVPSIDYGRGSSGEVSIKSTILFNLTLPVKVVAQTLVESRLLEEHGADVVMADTRASAVLAAKALGTPSVLILNQYRITLMKDKWVRLAAFSEEIVNSFTAVWSFSDRILVADYPPPLTITRENLVMRKVDEARAKYVGPLLLRRPGDFPDRPSLKSRLGFNPDEVLIAIVPTGPGPDRERFRDLVIKLFPHLVDYQVLMTGVSPRMLKSLDLSASERHRFVEWYDDECELLAAADIVLSRAGHTLAAKALAFGCRLIVTPIPRQTEQENNARALEEDGAAVVLPERDLTPEGLRKALRCVFEVIEEARLARYMDFAERHDAKKTVVDELLSAAKRRL
jgi:UDP-N-acetylglucosamine--N-acetylmuramyl-(pentapeptide) pyrophosphoryl-undecaprenol N-acetylglucosamine transferase